MFNIWNKYNIQITCQICDPLKVVTDNPRYVRYLKYVKYSQTTSLNQPRQIFGKVLRIYKSLIWYLLSLVSETFKIFQYCVSLENIKINDMHIYNPRDFLEGKLEHFSSHPINHNKISTHIKHPSSSPSAVIIWLYCWN